jgi:hypothetical protein
MGYLTSIPSCALGEVEEVGGLGARFAAAAVIQHPALGGGLGLCPSHCSLCHRYRWMQEQAEAEQQRLDTLTKFEFLSLCHCTRSFHNKDLLLELRQ